MQVAVDLVKSCREDGTKTPFLSMIINGEDGYLGRPLTDSELAEECMGGLYVFKLRRQGELCADHWKICREWNHSY